MDIPSYVKSFFNIVKRDCIEYCTKYNISPSVIASVAIIVSDWGANNDCIRTNNIFLLPIDSNWYGKCYSKDSKKFYNSRQECVEKNCILYRAYGSYTESIEDFVKYIIESKRSENGPLRYGSLIGVYDYKKAIDILIRLDFFSKYMHISDYISISNKMISIIENNNLFDWDKETEENIMSKKRQFYNRSNYSNTTNDTPSASEEIKENEIKDIENIEKENNENFEHMYRVRLDWDKPMTQIFASPEYEKALEEAKKHEGYKIYIDDDGELFEDPWVKEPQEIIDTSIPGVLRVIHPDPKNPIVLNNTPVYRNSINKTPFKYLSGIFYFYDSSIVNNRGKITVHKNIIKPDPSLILGYIDLI